MNKTNANNNILVNFFFETGDTTCKYWHEAYLVKSIPVRKAEFPTNASSFAAISVLKDKVAEFGASDDDYYEIAEEVLESLGCEYQPFVYYKVNKVTHILNIFA